MKSRRIAIYGAGGFAREVAWLVESCRDEAVLYEPACFIDDDESRWGTVLNGIPVVGLEEAAAKYVDAEVVVAVGNPRTREALAAKAAAAGLGFATLVHPRVERSRWIQYGEGTIICAGSILTVNISLGRHVQINLDCTVGHDVIMGDYTTLAPGVHVSGWVHFGKRVYVGTGAVFINGTQEKPLTIGDDVIIGAGACVTKSIESGTWGGCPPEIPIHPEWRHRPPAPSAGASHDQGDRFSTWVYPVVEDGKLTVYNWMVQHTENFRLGYRTDIGAFTYINAKYGVTIEDEVQIGSHCSIYSVSTIDGKSGPVMLKKGCRVGSHTTIMPGVTIGENAVVGAHSFVTRDVPPGAVAVGVPAKAKLLGPGAGQGS